MSNRRISATSVQGVRVAALVAALVAASVAGPALAQQQQDTAGYVSNLSGPLFAVKSDGSRRVLSTQSVVSTGDTLITEDKTYARVRFSDTSEVTLRPSTQFQIENYAFERAVPEQDNSAFRLLKGAFRTVTGLIGKRGNRDAYKLSTATATIGIRGTVFGVTVCLAAEAAAKAAAEAAAKGAPDLAAAQAAADAAAKKAKETCGGLAAGTYVNVIDGQVAIAPPLLPVPGAPPLLAPPIVLSAGQFGYAPATGPPVQLPSDPGVGRLFAPPPSFTQRQDAPPPVQLQEPGTPASGRITPPASGECEVR
jgi:hypothetical protein